MSETWLSPEEVWELTAPTFLRLADVKRRSGYSTSGLYETMQRGDFPRPLKRGGVSLWIQAEVDSVLALQAQTLPRMGQSVGRARAGRKKSGNSAT